MSDRVEYGLDSPPPAEPPTELGLTPGFGLAIWHVMHSVWMDHRPVSTDPERGGRCREPRCGRLWPCWGWRAARDTLEHMHRYPDGAGIVGDDQMPQVLLSVPLCLTRPRCGCDR
ncbi:MAG: hypothetical protein ACRDUA_08180 [Micromonosporaceae bacterium]